jgi:Nucleotidyltransferase domain
MPVRSLNMSVLAWPKKSQVESALEVWTRSHSASVPGLLGVGYIGSYSRGDWGVGSDLDLVLVLAKSDQPFERRALGFDATSLPVPVDMFIYTTEELASLLARGGRFATTLRREITWAWRRKDFPGLQD